MTNILWLKYEDLVFSLLIILIFLIPLDFVMLVGQKHCEDVTLDSQFPAFFSQSERKKENNQ